MEPPEFPPQVEIGNDSLTIWDDRLGSILFSMGFFGKPLGLRKPDPGDLKRPLTLSLFDALYLSEDQIITLTKDGIMIDNEEFMRYANEIYEDFENKYIVYRYFRKKGYVVRPGMKFGSDFAIYKQGPGIDHSQYVVHVEPDEKKLRAIDIVRAGRLAASVRKRYLIATLNDKNEPKFFGFDRVKI